MLVSWVDRDHAMLSTLVRNRMPHTSQDTVRYLTPSGTHVVQVRVVQVYQAPLSAYHSLQQQTAQQRILFSPTVTRYRSSSLIAAAMMRPSVWASSFGPPSRPVYHCEIISPVEYFFLQWLQKSSQYICRVQNINIATRYSNHDLRSTKEARVILPTMYAVYEILNIVTCCHSWVSRLGLPVVLRRGGYKEPNVWGISTGERNRVWAKLTSG